MVRAAVAYRCLQSAKVAAEQELHEGIGLPPSPHLLATGAQHNQLGSSLPETVQAICQGTGRVESCIRMRVIKVAHYSYYCYY